VLVVSGLVIRPALDRG
jgi:hypothetical protein